MSDPLLRQYAEEECVFEGYPFEWAHEVVWEEEDILTGQKITLPWQASIKDTIRELAGHRCQRCGHPYRKGEHSMEIDAEGRSISWSACDRECTHLGPVRMREIYRYGEWREVDLEEQGACPGDFMYEFGPDQRLIQRWEVDAKWRILTVHHLDEDKANCRWWNLVALCQRCHLRMQRAVHMDRPYLFEHSEWFKPYAAGFYAWKYLGEDLGREEVMSRMPALLALEHRFTQEAIF